MDKWNLPEEPIERQRRAQEIADEICDEYDELYYEYMNRLISNVGRVAIEKAPE